MKIADVKILAWSEEIIIQCPSSKCKLPADLTFDSGIAWPVLEAAIKKHFKTVHPDGK